jgi:hypothetical protein
VAELKTKTIAVGCVRWKQGGAVVEIVDEDDADLVFGTTTKKHPEIVAVLRDGLDQCERLTITYSERPWTGGVNRYIEDVIEATDEEPVEEPTPIDDSVLSVAALAGARETSDVVVSMRATELAAALVGHIEDEKTAVRFVLLIPALLDLFRSGASAQSLNELMRALGLGPQKAVAVSKAAETSTPEELDEEFERLVDNATQHRLGGGGNGR